MNIKLTLTSTIFLLFFLNAQGQSKYNFSQLNYNALLINPAYAGHVENLSIQGSYTGLVGGSILIGAPQLYNLSVHNKLANPSWGFGSILEIDKFNSKIGISLQPALARYFEVGEKGQLSVGLQSRLQFINFGFGQNILVPDNIFLANVGLGIFYNLEHFFVSLSVPSIVQISNPARGFTNQQIGEKPIYLYTGYWFAATDYIKIKAVLLGNRIQFFQFPTASNQELDAQIEWGINLNAIFSDRYWFGVGFGQVQNDDASVVADYQYLTLSAIYSFNIARLSYAFQQLLGNQNLSINTKHTILLEFDIKNGGQEKIVRYF